MERLPIAMAAVFCSAALLSGCTGSEANVEANNLPHSASHTVVPPSSLDLLMEQINSRSDGVVISIVMGPAKNRVYAKYPSDSGATNCLEYIDGELTRDEENCDDASSNVPFTVPSDISSRVEALAPAARAAVGSPLMSQIVVQQNVNLDLDGPGFEYYRVDPSSTYFNENSDYSCEFLSPQVVTLSEAGDVVDIDSTFDAISFQPPNGATSCDFESQLIPDG